MNKQNLMLIIIADTAQVYYLLLLYDGTEKTVGPWVEKCCQTAFFSGSKM